MRRSPKLIASLALLMAPVAYSQTPAAVFAPGVISTSAQEGPFAFSPDGQTVYLTRFDAGARLPNFFVSRLLRGRWGAPERVTFPEGAAPGPFSFSPDGKTLYYTHQPDSKGISRLWAAERDGAGWKNVRPLGGALEKWDTNQTSPSATADGMLYFTSDRRHHSGDWDVYRSALKDAVYQEAELIGGGRYAGISTAQAVEDLLFSPLTRARGIA